MFEQRIPARNSMFRLQYEKAQGCYVLLFPEGMVKLNDSAAEILQLIDAQKSIAMVTTVLEQKFPDAGSLHQDVNDFMQTAFEKKWIIDA